MSSTREKTVATELSCALGCLGVPLAAENARLVGGVKDSDIETLAAVMAVPSEFAGCSTLHASGFRVRRHLLLPDGSPVEWMGNAKLSNSSAAAKDIRITRGVKSHAFVSVKNDSSILWNGAVSRFIDKMWSGWNGVGHGKSENWFRKCAPDEYQACYAACDGPAFTGLATAAEYDAARGKAPLRGGEAGAVKRAFRDVAKAAVAANSEPYVLLCSKVAAESARIINGLIDANRRADGANSLARIYKNALWEIFRLNSINYYLCVNEGKASHALEVMSKEEWERRFVLKDISASVHEAKQPEVMLTFVVRDKELKIDHALSVLCEIRWSHGKFCGNPEAKLKKKSLYAELPWNAEIGPAGAGDGQ